MWFHTCLEFSVAGSMGTRESLGLAEASQAEKHKVQLEGDHALQEQRESDWRGPLPQTDVFWLLYTHAQMYTLTYATQISLTYTHSCTQAKRVYTTNRRIN